MLQTLYSIAGWPLCRERRWWFGCGTAVGLAVPVVFFSAFLTKLNPEATLLSCPALFPAIGAFRFSNTDAGAYLVLFSAWALNGIIYGVITAALPRGSVVAAAALLLAVWFSLPPSDATKMPQ